MAGSDKARLEARRRMGFVLQKPVVFNASVYENVACGLKWRGLDKRRVREKTNGILERVDLIGYQHRNARTLSGGEMQRVAIARAIAVEPEVLLLDEPTANLDPISASHIEELITAIIKRDAITVIMATHDMWGSPGGVCYAEEPGGSRVCRHGKHYRWSGCLQSGKPYRDRCQRQGYRGLYRFL
jgi:tungstate transport system ATP-binding protein